MPLHRRPRRRASPMLLFYMGLLVLLCCLVFGALYQLFYRQSEMKSLQSNEMALSLLQQELDAQVSFMKETTAGLKGDPDIVNAIMGQYPYDDYRTVKKLASYKRFNAELLDIVILDYHRDRAYGSSGVAPMEEYFDRYVRTLYAPAQMINDIRLYEADTFYQFMTIKPYDKMESQEAVLCITTISPQRKILFVLDEALFTRPIEKFINDQQGLFYILDMQGNTLLCAQINASGPLKTDAVFPRDLPFEPWSEHIQTYIRDDVLAMLVPSAMGSFQYGITTDASLFTAEITHKRLWFIVSLIALLCIGFMASLALAHLSYRPITQLKSYVLGQESTPALSTGWRDLDMIQDQFAAVLFNLNSVSLRLQKDRQFLHESLVVGLVSSTSAYERNQELYLREGIFFPYAQLWALAMQPPDAAHAAALVANIQAELSGQGILCHLSQENDYGVIIALINAQETAVLDGALGTIARLCLGEGLPCRIGVGEAVGSVSQMRLSFIQALSALSETQGTLRYRDMKNPTPLHRLNHLTQVKQRLRGALQKGVMPDVESLINDAFFATEDKAQHIFTYSELVSALMDVAAASHFVDLQFGNTLYCIYSSRQDMIGSLLYFLGQLCNHLAAKRNDPSYKLLHELQLYIKAHYQEPSLSAQSIADTFHISASYLNKYLKELCGETVFSLLDGVRMDRAKHLLVTTEQPLREIVRYVGYGDMNHFTKKFKKQTGLTPTEYRHTHRVQDEQLSPMNIAR